MVDRLFTALLLEATTGLWSRAPETFGNGKKIFAFLCTTKVSLGMYLDGYLFKLKFGITLPLFCFWAMDTRN